MTTTLLFALVAVVLTLLLATPGLALIARRVPAAARVVLALAAAVACAGCSTHTEPPKPRPIHWTAPDTGYHADTPPSEEDP